MAFAAYIDHLNMILNVHPSDGAMKIVQAYVKAMGVSNDAISEHSETFSAADIAVTMDAALASAASVLAYPNLKPEQRDFMCARLRLHLDAQCKQMDEMPADGKRH